jgi:hypothetical protein
MLHLSLPFSLSFKTSVALMVSVLCASSCRAQIGVGARALGMGGAYTAIADDVYASYWNPAGVAGLRGVHASIPNLNARLAGPIKADTLLNHFPSSTAGQIQLAQRAGTSITQADVSGDIALAFPRFALTFLPFATGQVIPRNANGGVGFHYLNFQGTQVPEPGSQADINTAIGFQTMATFAVPTDAHTSAGLNLKLTNYQPTNINVSFDGTTAKLPVRTTTGRPTLGFGADAGALWRATPEVSVGATLRDFIRPNVRQNGMEVSPTNLTLGAAYRSRNHRLLVAADVAEIGSGRTAFNFGGEVSLHRYLQARAGVYQGRPTFGAGIGPIFNVAFGANNTLLGVSLGF